MIGLIKSTPWNISKANKVESCSVTVISASGFKQSLMIFLKKATVDYFLVLNSTLTKLSLFLFPKRPFTENIFGFESCWEGINVGTLLQSPPLIEGNLLSSVRINLGELT